MYTGEWFRLGEAVLGIERVNGRHVAIPIPSGETVVVLSGPKLADTRLVDVRWAGRTFLVFAEDIQARGKELKQSGAERVASRAASA
jgi:hypothetical protein